MPKSNQSGKVFDSLGPAGRVRGTAHQLRDRYLAFANDAELAGDPIAESYYQFADHYQRVHDETTPRLVAENPPASS